MECSSKVLLFTGNLSGHRESYLNFASKLLKGRRGSKKDILLKKEPVLFLMVEDSFFFYFISGLFRSLLGRKTVGLLFRPKPAIEANSLRLKIKKYILKLLKCIPSINTLLIIPTSLDKDFDSISDGWIYDFQFWDVTDLEYNSFSENQHNKKENKLRYAIKDLADNRKIISAIGTQNIQKGFDIFLNEYLSNEKIRREFLFSFGGKSNDKFNKDIKIFLKEKGFALNKFISDEELLTIYSSSDLIWALYSEKYDQASGIFGRAVQYGIPVIVRENSLIHKISIMENISHIALTKDNISNILDINIDIPNLLKGKEFKNKFKEKSLNQIKKSLGIIDE